MFDCHEELKLTPLTRSERGLPSGIELALFWHNYHSFHAAVSAKKDSISVTSSSARRNSPTRITPSAWLALRAPTMAPVTAGWCSVQASATSPADRLWRLAIACKRSTSARLRERFGSVKSGCLLRQASWGSLAARSRVMAPVSRPDAIGE